MGIPKNHVIGTQFLCEAAIEDFILLLRLWMPYWAFFCQPASLLSLSSEIGNVSPEGETWALELSPSFTPHSPGTEGLYSKVPRFKSQISGVQVIMAARRPLPLLTDAGHLCSCGDKSQYLHWYSWNGQWIYRILFLFLFTQVFIYCSLTSGWCIAT